MSPILSLCLAILTLSGCFWHAQVKPSEKPFDMVITFADEAVLASGGTLAFAPLRAGPQASEDDQSDRVSAAIIAAVIDRLAQAKTSLTVVPEGDSDLIFRGYIEDLSQNGRFKRVVLRRDKGRLAISGEIYLSSTGAKVLSFAGYAHLDRHQKVFQVAGTLGAALGDEIARRAVKESGT